MKASYFNAPIRNINPQHNLILRAIFQIIRFDQLLIEITKKLRESSTKEGKNKIKINELPFVTFSGMFSSRTSEGLIQHSGLICIDIDGLSNEQMNSIREKLKTIEKKLIGYFISPSGNGYKIIMRIDYEKFSQEQNYNACCNYLSQKLAIDIENFDKACKDVARACFLCSDPDAFLNEEFETIQTIDKLMPMVVSNNKRNISSQNLKINPYSVSLKLDYSHKHDYSNFLVLFSLAVKAKGEYKVGNRHNFIVCLASLCNRFGMVKKTTIEYCIRLLENNSETINKDAPFEIEKELVPTIEDLYTRYANEFGIGITEEDDIENPMLKDYVFEHLPDAIKKLLAFFKGRDRDVLFLSLLGVFSNWMPRVQGVYSNKFIGANLFLIIAAPASAGKGVMDWARIIAQESDGRLREDFRRNYEIYEEELKEWEEKKEGSRPIKPKLKRFFLPANISTAALMSAMDANGYFGLIFETEADSLTNTLGNREWGNYTDILRKSFQHERVTSLRKSNEEEFIINKPHLSMVLSGTPLQIKKLVSNIENGFFSRILFYDFPIDMTWKDNFAKTPEFLEDYFESKSKLLTDLLSPLFDIDMVDKTNRIVFKFTKDQENKFNSYFEKKQEDLHMLFDNTIIASIRRLALIQFRIAMIISVFRIIDESNYSTSNYSNISMIECKDIDFELSHKIIETLLYHTMSMFKKISSKRKNKNLLTLKEEWFKNLPEDFDRTTAMHSAFLIGIKEKTAESYLAKFVEDGLLTKPAHNHYKKI